MSGLSRPLSTAPILILRISTGAAYIWETTHVTQKLQLHSTFLTVHTFHHLNFDKLVALESVYGLQMVSQGSGCSLIPTSTIC